MSSKPSLKNKNLSKRTIQELHPKKATSLMGGDPKASPAGILKRSKPFSREMSGDSGFDEVRRVFHQPAPAKARPETRIYQSATYSPVSHCVTRYNATMFEKKKLRMAKIQQLRGVSHGD